MGYVIGLLGIWLLVLLLSWQDPVLVPFRAAPGWLRILALLLLGVAWGELFVRLVKKRIGR